VKLEVIMHVSTRRRYTDAFKTEALRLVSESGGPVAQIARDLGISDNVLYRWVSGQRHTRAQGTTPATLREEREELAMLKHENVLLRQEQDFYDVRRRSSRESAHEIPRDSEATIVAFPFGLMCRTLAVSAAGYYA
jgi:transposase